MAGNRGLTKLHKSYTRRADINDAADADKAASEDDKAASED